MKTKINLIVNIISFFVFLIISFTGIALWKVLPSGNGLGGGRSLSGESVFLGLVRHQWNDVHLYAGLVLIVLVFIHLVFHWTWIRNIPKLLKN